MNANNPTLILSTACTALPPTAKSVHAWLEEVAGPSTASDALDYHAFTEMVFSARGIDHRQMLRPKHVLEKIPGAIFFRDALQESQSELACRAVSKLSEQIGTPGRFTNCGLMMYSHTAVDENFHQSTACRIASEFGLSKTPHFSVAQLQGASFFQALDIGDALFRTNETINDALFVAAEKWPEPYPRVLGLSTVLGDGAVAMLFTRDDSKTGLRLRRSTVKCHDDFGDVHSYRAAMNLSVMCRAVEQIVNDMTSACGVALNDIELFLPSGASAELDHTVLANLGVSSDLVLNDARYFHENTGYLSAADSPYKIAQVLQLISNGKLADGALVLAYGVGLGGSVGAALFDVVRSDYHE